MKRFLKRWKIRLGALRSVLTTEFILIHSIKRKDNEQGEAMTLHTVVYRTDNPDWHDFLVVKGEAFRKYEMLPAYMKTGINP